MKYPKIKGLSNEINKKIELCAGGIIHTIDHYFPEIRESWNKEDPDSFESRVLLSLYLELIHAGFFENENN